MHYNSYKEVELLLQGPHHRCTPATINSDPGSHTRRDDVHPLRIFYPSSHALTTTFAYPNPVVS